MAKRFISLLLCITFAVTSSLTVPAFASDASGVSEFMNSDFFSWVFQAGYHTMAGIFSKFFDEVCPSAPGLTDKHSFVERRTTVDGKMGLYYICEYCGKSAGEVGNEAYQQQVESLPAPGYTSDGSLLWSPQIECFYLVYWPNRSYYVAGCQHYVREPDDLDFNGITSFDCDNHIVAARLPSGSSYLNLSFLEFRYSGVRPVDGFYFQVNSPKYEGYYTTTSGKFPLSSTYPVSSGSVYFYEASTSYSFSERVSPGVANGIVTFHLQVFAPVYKVTPLEAIDTTPGGQYNITTRPTAITGGNYGIIGDNNQITTITDNRQIINEGDNLYYNPATGQTYTITDWTYNYDGRIYNITLDTGDTVQVEYGDQNITITENNIVEGDTIVNNYTIYYIIDGSGSGDNPSPTPGPTACPHDWQAGSSTAPTCTAPGKTAYTCSKCGETKTETVPALGHDWKVVRTVSTEYDENGVQTQAGYTLYECTRCGEQYKDTDSTGPPGNDVEDGGLLDWLNGLIKHLSDNLSGVVGLILRFFREVPELFGGFTGFLAAVFPFLPDEIMLLLTFGMAALVVVGVIKAIRR